MLPAYFPVIGRTGVEPAERDLVAKVEWNMLLRSIHHTTLCAGKDVLCAGTMSIKNGELRAITNNSGHYKLDTLHLTQVLNLLADAGVPLAGVVVVDNAQGQLETMANPFMAGNYKPFPASRINQVLIETN